MFWVLGEEATKYYKFVNVLGSLDGKQTLLETTNYKAFKMFWVPLLVSRPPSPESSFLIQCLGSPIL